MELKKYKLLPSNEVLRRLRQIEDNEELINGLYVHLAVEGGKELTAVAFVTAIYFALSRFLSQRDSTDGADLFMSLAPSYIECLTDDPEGVAEAKNMWQNLLEFIARNK